MNSTAKIIVALLVGLVGGYFIGNWHSKTSVDSITDLENETIEAGSDVDDTITDPGSLADDSMLSDDDDSATTPASPSESPMVTITPTPTPTPTSMSIGINTVVGVNQLAGAFVNVSNVTLSNRGWVVVYEDANGELSNILGAKRLEAGTYSDVRVSLLRSTKAGMTYHVVLHADDGINTFDYIPSKRTTDLPLSTSAGQLITATFMTTGTASAQ